MSPVRAYEIGIGGTAIIAMLCEARNIREMSYYNPHWTTRYEDRNAMLTVKCLSTGLCSASIVYDWES